MFSNCDNYSVHRSSNPNPTNDDVKPNDNVLHQQICTCFKGDYLEEMDIIKQTKRSIEQKINETLPAHLLNKLFRHQRAWLQLQVSKGNCTLALEKREQYQ